MTLMLGCPICANLSFSAQILSIGQSLNYEFSNQALPYFGNPGCENQPAYVDEDTGISYPNCFGDTLALGFWDDLYIYADTQQGIYYDVVGPVGARVALFEFYIGSFGGEDQYYHFILSFFEARPNVVEYHYLNVSDHGTSATVGVESKTGKWIIYRMLWE